MRNIVQGTELENHEVYDVTYKNGQVYKGIVGFQYNGDDVFDMRAVVDLLPDGEPLVATVPSDTVQWVSLAHMYFDKRDALSRKDSVRCGQFVFKRLRTLDDIKEHFEVPGLFAFLSR